MPNKFPVGSKHNGVVKKHPPYGVFVELDAKVIGEYGSHQRFKLDKGYNHPNDFTKEVKFANCIRN
ncbi:MAG: hypothetical protein IPQ19_15430 [Bacteroidetes bacterium]|nr:hypothetical protein [Bacteroidota bacterium]